MEIKDILRNVIDPALRALPPMMTSDNARAMLLAIHLQEDPQQRRRQWPSGPARGLWQFERDTGVAEVLRHHATRDHAITFAWRLGIAGTVAAVYNMLDTEDVLAAGIARLALWRYPKPLPGEDGMDEGRDQYLRIWRPGAFRPDDWPDNWTRAWEAVKCTK